MNIGKKEKDKVLQDMLDVLEQFAIGRFDFLTPAYQEGISSKIYSRLEQLGKSIELHSQRLVEEKEATKALITDISHQLRTPLSGLKTSHYLLQEEELTAAERQEFIHLIGSQIEHLENLTDALINVSRMETGIISLRAEYADIAETIRAAAESIRPKAELKEITVEETGLTSFMLNHDPKWIREALINILDNAVKYSPAGSRIKIEAGPGQMYYRIQVSDEGIGVPPEEYGRIYTRFYRGKSDVVKAAEGSGVGLYLSRKIVEGQGGTLTNKAGSESGTVFIMQLPLA